MQMLKILAKAPNVDGLKDKLHEVQKLIQEKHSSLRSGRVPPKKLIVHQTVSRTLEEFRSPSLVALALEQLETEGKTPRSGQPLRFVDTSGIPRAIAWDLPDPFNPDSVNIPRYSKLLDRAVDTVLEAIMKRVGENQKGQLTLDF